MVNYINNTPVHWKLNIMSTFLFDNDSIIYSNFYISDQSICIIWLVSFLILKSVAPCDIMVESERDWLFLFILDKYDFWRCCRYSPKHSLKLWLLCSLLILLLFQARCIHIYAPQTICRMWSCKVQRNKQKTCLNSEL